MLKIRNFFVGQADTFKREEYKTKDNKKINCIKLGAIKATKHVEGDIVTVNKKEIYLTSQHMIMVVNMENIIVKPKEKSKLDYIEFNITKTICDEIYYKNFNFELFGLEENPILTIRDNIEKKN